MNQRRLLTADQFAEEKYDLPDGGRWAELIAGEVVTLDPPDAVHGNVVLNLSKALAEYLGPRQNGYACYELGLVVAREPDTVRCPPISFFTGSELFAEADKTVTAARPALIVEIPSTPSRREGLRERIEAYLAWGVELVWVAETKTRQVVVHRQDRPLVRLGTDQFLTGEPLLSDFEISVADLFADPEWWR